jgi:hypothetical protein
VLLSAFYLDLIIRSNSLRDLYWYVNLKKPLNLDLLCFSRYCSTKGILIEACVSPLARRTRYYFASWTQFRFVNTRIMGRKQNKGVDSKETESQGLISTPLRGIGINS